MASLDPLSQIRKSCLWVSANSLHVSINQSVLQEAADDLYQTDFESLRHGVAWDACGWHYNLDSLINGPRTCQYVFVMDALNFCFWPCPGFEYDTLATSLKLVLEADINAFDADRLVALTEVDLLNWFPSSFDLANNPDFVIPERLQRLHEVGQALLDNFDGLAANLVHQADGSASKMVQLILQYIPGFRDTMIYQGRLVHFYKRAQILVGDVWAAYGRPTNPTHPYYFRDIDQLTMFADYRVPQILRHMGVLVYQPALAQAVDAGCEVPSGSAEEAEIRAQTVVAVDALHAALVARGVPRLLVIELDWLLWQRGEAVKDEIAPHHRTRTIYY